MTDPTALNLNEFEPATYDQWRAAAEASLKGAPFDKKLLTRTHEGILVQPLYDRSDLEKSGIPGGWPGVAPFMRGPSPLPRPPLVAQEIPLGTPTEFNTAALEALMCGQNALAIHLDVASRRGLDPSEAETSEVGVCGLSLACLEDARTAFKDIEPQAVDLLLWAGSSALPLIGLLSAHSADWKGAVLGDPLTEYARDGSLPIALDDAFNEMAAAVAWSRSCGSRLRTVGVGANLWGDAGGSAIEELAFGLATAVEYLRELAMRGMSAEDAAGQFVFTYSLGSDILLQIAKIRAARLLWSRILEFCGASPVAAHIHGRSTLVNKAGLDPYTNMLRATAEGFAGSISGVDSMHVAPFDECLRTPGEFSRRIARNVHAILAEECLFTATADPSGGSWAIESLTAQLAAKAWDQFREVEALGGMTAALREGMPQRKTEEVAKARLGAAASRRDSLIGVNLFPNPAETSLATGDPDHQARHAERAAYLEKIRAHTVAKLERSVGAVSSAFAAQATLGQVSEALPRSAPCEPEITRVPVRRLAEAFEGLRANSARYAKSHGHLPVVWLANFGPPKQHKARADFSAGFLAVAGFDVHEGPGATGTDEAVEAAAVSKSLATVICSTDESYPEIVPAFVAALRAKRPKMKILLAGYPADHIDAFKEAGVDGFIHIRANCLEFLQDLQKQLGITR